MERVAQGGHGLFSHTRGLQEAAGQPSVRDALSEIFAMSRGLVLMALQAPSKYYSMCNESWVLENAWLFMLLCKVFFGRREIFQLLDVLNFNQGLLLLLPLPKLTRVVGVTAMGDIPPQGIHYFGAGNFSKPPWSMWSTW